MEMVARRGYLKQLQTDYLKANKEEKTSILNEYTKNTGHNRKYVIHQLNRVELTSIIKNPGKKRKSRYGAELLGPLEKLYEIFDCPCAQRLKPAIEAELERLRSFGEIILDDDSVKRLKEMSTATLNRRLSTLRKKYAKKGISTTKPGSLLKKQIPIRLTQWDTQKVGFMEVDLVAHCGSNASGQFAHTASLTEICSGWWEGEAIPNKGQLATLEAIQNMRQRTPFKWLGLDSDNGSEFINHHLFKWCHEESLEFTRSRPNHKNDNAYIEQKNWTHVRQIVGYARYDTPDEIEIINSLYRHELRLYKNFFLPQLKLKSKTRKGGHLKRQYETAKTPYQRLLESTSLSEDQSKALKTVYEQLNPAQLKRQIDQKLFALRLAYQNKGWNNQPQKDHDRQSLAVAGRAT
jgi:hypothetical protein